MRLAIVTAVLAACVVTAPLVAGGEPPLTVYAASSLRAALPEHDPAPRYSFAASGTLQLQIERGAPADVFLSAAPREAQALHRAGRCTRPRAFAANRLVLLVAAGNPAGIRSLRDLDRARRRLAVGGPGVPVGDYARRLLATLGRPGLLRRNTVSSELNSAGITAKVAAGSAEAGFAYATDARAAASRVEAVELPADAQPPIRYQACAVLRRGADPARAQRWIDGMLGARGRAVLARHGFRAP